MGEEDEIKPLWMGCFHKTSGGRRGEETDQPSDGENPESTNFRYFRPIGPICDPYQYNKQYYICLCAKRTNNSD